MGNGVAVFVQDIGLSLLANLYLFHYGSQKNGVAFKVDDFQHGAAVYYRGGDNHIHIVPFYVGRGHIGFPCHCRLEEGFPGEVRIMKGIIAAGINDTGGAHVIGVGLFHQVRLFFIQGCGLFLEQAIVGNFSDGQSIGGNHILCCHGSKFRCFHQILFNGVQCGVAGNQHT